MSADNYLFITKDFKVYNMIASVSHKKQLKKPLFKGKTLEETVEFARDYAYENEVEYGISFG